MPFRSPNWFGIPALVRVNIDYIGRPFSCWIPNKIDGVACDARLPTTVGKYHGENRIAHTRFALAVDLIRKARWQSDRTVRNLGYILNTNPFLGFVIFGKHSPGTEIGFLRLDIHRVEIFSALQGDPARIIGQLTISAWHNPSQGLANEIRQCGISSHSDLFKLNFSHLSFLRDWEKHLNSISRKLPCAIRNNLAHRFVEFHQAAERPVHSQRMAHIGSILAARNAGSSEAALAMIARATMDPANTQGSLGDVP